MRGNKKKWYEGAEYRGWRLKKELDNYVSPHGVIQRRFLVECIDCSFTKESNLCTIKQSHICEDKKFERIKVNKEKAIKVPRIKKESKIVVRVSVENREILNRLAKEEEMSISAMIRRAIRHYIKKELGNP